MNLFILSRNRRKNARYHCDRHVTKMIVEAAQQASSALSVVSPSVYQYHQEHIYKVTHVKHPCVIWCTQSFENYKYACEYGILLSIEFENRYKHSHKSRAVVEYLLKVGEEIKDQFKQQELTPFAQAMPEEYRCDDAIKAYRNYYIHDKKKIATWKTEEPKWFTDNRLEDSEQDEVPQVIPTIKQE
ncbi:Conserved_hypothetical protein [Hexamita inflata]|uniref:Uncharacterized protein n=1 Tax=Hexamita inflata TaxID=28002 RepID=A0AA86RER0_9EUKA|nr:Conserved hypothetical protein [Hexamita inflata]